MIYDVGFSVDAAVELLRIAEVVGSAVLVLKAAEKIRRHLEDDPADKGKFLAEGLYYIDQQPLRAFFLIDVESMVVEITDFRILQLSEAAVQDAMKLITNQINFCKKVSTHTRRHSYATHLREAGVSLKVIQQYMGHSSLATTMVYLHLTQTAEANARETIERLFRRG